MGKHRRRAVPPPVNEVERRYRGAVDQFDKAVSEATQMSQAAAGRQVDPKRWWASVLFTRLCTTAVSLVCLAPRSRLAGRYIEHFDFSAVASLTRNLAECYLAFFYLCVDSVDEDEWLTRLNLLQLHDCTERYKMFRDFDSNHPQLPGFQTQADELGAQLQTRKHFASLDPKQQKRFLTGDYAWLLPQDKLLMKLGVDVGGFRGFYRLLSSHTHSFPMAFYRMAERDQGRGVESDWEKEYTSLALDFAADTVRRGTKDMRGLFPDISS